MVQLSKIRELSNWRKKFMKDYRSFEDMYNYYKDENNYMNDYLAAMSYSDKLKKSGDWVSVIQNCIIDTLAEYHNRALERQDLIEKTFYNLPLYPGEKDYLTRDSGGVRMHYRSEINYEIDHLLKSKKIKRYCRGCYCL